MICIFIQRPEGEKWKFHFFLLLWGKALLSAFWADRFGISGEFGLGIGPILKTLQRLIAEDKEAT